jgi:hypothetical protein
MLLHVIWDTVHVIQERIPEKVSFHCNKSFSNVIWWKETIVSYIGKIEMVINQLTNIGNKTFTTRAIIAKTMNNLLTKYESVMSTWDSTLNVAKTLENFTLRLFQQEVGLKNRLEGGVKKVTT